MAEFSNETKEWLDRAKKGERPFSMSYDHGTLVLSMVRDVHDKITPIIFDRGLACWRAVDKVRRRRLRFKAQTDFHRVDLDPTEPGVSRGALAAELRLPEPHPETETAIDVDYSCRFDVNNKGFEEL